MRNFLIAAAALIAGATTALAQSYSPNGVKTLAPEGAIKTTGTWDIGTRAGDFVFGPKNRWHHLEPTGTEPSIRVAINARGEFHRYDRPGCKPL